MGKPSRATQAKRSRELAKQERSEQKRIDRAQKKELKKLAELNRTQDDQETDPDLIGIFPGPQPQPKYE